MNAQTLNNNLETNLQSGCDRLRGVTFEHSFYGLRFIIDFIDITHFQSGLEFGTHVHSVYEIHHIHSGYGQVGIQGSVFDLSPGDFYITGPGVNHWQKASENNPMVEYCIRMTLTKDFNTLVPTDLIPDDMLQLLQVLDEHPRYVVQENGQISTLFQKIFLEAYYENLGYQQVISTLFVQLIFTMTRLYTDKKSNVPLKKVQLNTRRMTVISQYILDNMHQKITYEILANHIFISPRHLERIIKEETGSSLHQWIMDLRIERAKAYLKDSSLKLREIAEKTGFSNEFHFSRSFKQHTGMNPSECRAL